MKDRISFLIFFCSLFQSGYFSPSRITNKIHLALYEIYALENCTDSGNGDIIYADNEIIKLANNTPTLNGTLIVKKTITDSIIAVVDIAKYVNEAWFPHFFTIELPVCKSPETLLQSFEDLKKLFSIKCPIEPGEYYLRDVQIKRPIKFTMIPYGKYRSEIQLYEGDTKIYCKIAYAELKPLES